MNINAIPKKDLVYTETYTHPVHGTNIFYCQYKDSSVSLYYQQGTEVHHDGVRNPKGGAKAWLKEYGWVKMENAPEIPDNCPECGIPEDECDCDWQARLEMAKAEQAEADKTDMVCQSCGDPDCNRPFPHN